MKCRICGADEQNKTILIFSGGKCKSCTAIEAAARKKYNTGFRTTQAQFEFDSFIEKTVKAVVKKRGIKL